MEINLKKTIHGFDGKPVIDNQTEEPMTTKDLLLHYLGSFTSNEGKQMVAAIALGQKIFKKEAETIKLSDDEKVLLIQAVRKPKHVAIVYCGLLDNLGLKIIDFEG